MEDQAREIEQLYSSLQVTEEKAKADIITLNRDKEAEITNLASEVCHSCPSVGSRQNSLTRNSRRLNKRKKTDFYRKPCKQLQAMRPRSYSLRINAFISWRKRYIVIPQVVITFIPSFSNLLPQVQSLRNERAAKAREFSEAQQHIGRLMNVMGFSANPNEKSSNKSQRSRDADIAPTPSRRQSTTYDEDDDIQLAESFESLASNLQAPTPKRPKGNGRSIHPLQAPAPETPAPGSAEANANVPRTGPRQPLIEAGTNRPVKSQVSLGSKRSQYNTALAGNMGENRLQDLDLDMDLDFSKDFIFTSAAFSPTNS